MVGVAIISPDLRAIKNETSCHDTSTGYLRGLLMLLLALRMLVVSNADAQQRHARRIVLVIGNDNYTHVSKLQKAGNDAAAMERELKAAGFDEVLLHRDLNYRSMVKAVESFTQAITGGDQVVVFFAGHGVQIKIGSYLNPRHPGCARFASG